MIIKGINVQPGAAEYPRNQWYVAAFSCEVTREPMHRTLFDEPIVFYRTEAGEPVALFDRCPHRGMRLSNGGVLFGNTIQCHYHGIRFDQKGRGCLIPSGGTPTSAMSVRRYALKEIGGWIWIWAGEAELADESIIPDHDALGITASGFHAYYGLALEANSNYLFSLENLVDATHISFLHHGLIDDGNVAAHPFSCHQDGVRVSMVREFKNETIAPMVAKAMALKGKRADRTLELISYAPSTCVVRQHFVETDGEHSARRDSRLIFGITPTGPRSCIQFVAMANDYENTHPGVFEDLRHLLMEDVVALDDIQILFDRLGQDRAPEISVRSDEGAIRTRRLIAGQIAQEQRAAKVTS
ncbi:aromatic ring-hydroxylating dioxygenase subunit alpha [Nitrospirillum iridis]|uniref:Vanillate O-demethylase monooxygenase subunit n=1 Tax=Nitrospirillum iridis TaxID=765888 RepID=A0A7X0B3P7_9PROT|nr:aromatic ring-hydroxylating dioxygenase subunit alpha [Nitrospirillum iridis]MBB6255172.1 vanillate O-demethylase monooxygenase subunit [Nitrospirillum iridis]